MDYERSFIRHSARLSMGFWIILLAVEKLPSIIEGKGFITSFIISLSVLIIGLDIAIADLYYYDLLPFKKKKGGKKNNGGKT